MGATERLLAKGPGWSAGDVVCDSGPADRPFEEAHEVFSIAVVSEGTFQYRTDAGSAVLTPGAVLLGNRGACFSCGHDHATGDRCLSFKFDPALFEDVVAATPGARRAMFTCVSLPPLEALAPLVANAEAARDADDADALEEIGLRLAGAAIAALADAPQRAPMISPRDAGRITEAVRRIEAEAHDPIPVTDLARSVGMSAPHFLRTFARVVGVTPHQYVLRTRLHRAAVRLRNSQDTISAIAFDAGFADLSTFNRRFRAVIGMTPGAYRAG